MPQTTNELKAIRQLLMILARKRKLPRGSHLDQDTEFTIFKRDAWTGREVAIAYWPKDADEDLQPTTKLRPEDDTYDAYLALSYCLRHRLVVTCPETQKFCITERGLNWLATPKKDEAKLPPITVLLKYDKNYMPIAATPNEELTRRRGGTAALLGVIAVYFEKSVGKVKARPRESRSDWIHRACDEVIAKQPICFFPAKKLSKSTKPGEKPVPPPSYGSIRQIAYKFRNDLMKLFPDYAATINAAVRSIKAGKEVETGMTVQDNGIVIDFSLVRFRDTRTASQTTKREYSITFERSTGTLCRECRSNHASIDDYCERCFSEQLKDAVRVMRIADSYGFTPQTAARVDSSGPTGQT